MVEKKKTKKPPAKEKQLVRRQVEVCEKCGTENPFRQQEGMRDVGPFRHANARCKVCRAVATIRREKTRTA